MVLIHLQCFLQRSKHEPPRPNLHDGNSSDFVSMQYCVKNRCRSTPPRQEARVHVEDPTEIKQEVVNTTERKIIRDALYKIYRFKILKCI